MGNESISKAQAICLIFLFIAGSSLAVPTGAKAGNDVWIATLLALVIAIIISLIYSRLLTLFRKKNLFDILQIVFGKFLGNLLILISVWYIFHLGVLVLRDQGYIITTLTLPETPEYAPLLLLILLCSWGAKHGITVLGRCGIVFTEIIIFIIVCIAFLLIPQMNFNNIIPILFDGLEPVFLGTSSTLSFLLDVVAITVVLSSLQNEVNIYGVFIKGILMAVATIFIIAVMEIVTIGAEIYTATYYPLYSIVSMIRVGFLEKIDFIAIIIVTLAHFAKITICLLCVCVGICKIFNLPDYKFITIPIGLLMLNLTMFIHENIMDKTQWITKFGFLYFIPFQVLLPLSLLITTEIKRKTFFKAKKTR